MEKNIKSIARIFFKMYLKKSDKDNVLLETCYIVYRSLKNIPLKNEDFYNESILLLKESIDQFNKDNNYLINNEKKILFLLWKTQQLLYIYEKNDLYIQEVSFLSGIIEESLEYINYINNKENVNRNILEFPKK